MKNIKSIFIVFLVFLMACNDEVNRPIYQDNELGQFVRFALLLDDNGNPISDESGVTDFYVKNYHHEVFDTITIPVSLTSSSLTEELSVSFSNTFYGDNGDIVSYIPDSILTFSPSKFNDSIRIVFKERWFPEVKDSIVLKLENVSLPDITIGYPFGDSINDALTIHLDEINLPITISKPNEFEIDANEVDTFNFYIEFENGFILEEIRDQKLLVEAENDLDYTLVQHPYQDGDLLINYSFILNSPVIDKFEDHKCVFNLDEPKGYKPWGRTSVTVAYTGLEKYSFTLSSEQKSIDGNLNENIAFYVIFSSPIDENIIDNINKQSLLTELEYGFEHTLTQQAVSVGDDTVTYILEVTESLADKASEQFVSSYALADIDGFTKYGFIDISIIKEKYNEGDNSLNPAAIFYNSSAPGNYSQVWHHMYIDRNNSCTWWESFQHCYPVEVDASHRNAVLHSNGKYYHAFRFGFNTPNAGRTTNSFGLKYLFDNEYTDADKSPGFNIPEAMELFPKDGTSRTEGTVSVIEQELTISSKTDDSFTYSIAGEGTYYYDEGSYDIYQDSIYTIELKLEVTSEELFGGTKIVNYKFKNRDLDNTEKPTYEPDYCIPTIDLNNVN